MDEAVVIYRRRNLPDAVPFTSEKIMGFVYATAECITAKEEGADDEERKKIDCHKDGQAAQPNGRLAPCDVVQRRNLHAYTRCDEPRLRLAGLLRWGDGQRRRGRMVRHFHCLRQATLSGVSILSRAARIAASPVTVSPL